eukprot:Clim_evm1s183 gene=Clim_evmTU1s183
MKFVSFVATVTALVGTVAGQGTVEDLELRWFMGSVMATRRSDISATVVGNLVFVVGGCVADAEYVTYGEGDDAFTVEVCPEVSGLIERLDTNTGQWETMSTTLATPRARHATAAVGNSLYICGGRPEGDDFGRAMDSCEIYNTVTNTIAAGPTFPVKVSDFAAVGVDGKAFFFGGWENEYAYTFDNAYTLNNNGDGWTEIGSLNTGRGDFGAAADSEGKIYAVGGFHLPQGSTDFVADLVVLADVEVLDPTAENPTWDNNVVSEMAQARGDQAVAPMQNGEFIVAVGGEQKDELFNHIATSHAEVLDVTSGSWTTIADMPSNRFRFAAVEDPSTGHVLVMGGHSQGKAVLDLNERLVVQEGLNAAELTTLTEDGLEALHRYSVSHTAISDQPFEKQELLAEVDKRISEAIAANNEAQGDDQNPSESEGDDDDDNDSEKAENIAIAAIVISVMSMILSPVLAYFAAQRAVQNNVAAPRHSKFVDVDIPMTDSVTGSVAAPNQQA